MSGNPVMALEHLLRERGELTGEFITEYMGEVQRLIETGQLRLDWCDEEGMHFVFTGKEDHGQAWVA